MYQRIFFVFVYYTFISNLTFGQLQRPKVSFYNQETTLQKLKQDYPFIDPIICSNSPKNYTVKTVNYSKNLEADLYQPTHFNHLPPIILIHGGGWISGSKENLSPLAQEISNLGYFVFNLNYTLSDEAKFPQPINDIKTAIDYLHLHNKNTDKVILIGASAGGQIATLFGVQNPDFVKAIINIDGIVSFIHPESEESITASFWLNGTKEQNFDIWKSASPLEYVNSKTPPTYFINSSIRRFRAGRDEYISKLNRYQINNNFVELKNTPHSFWLVQPWFDETVYHVINYLNQINE